jgi:GlpG protein
MNEAININLLKTEISLKKYIPILTTICGLISIVLFVGINLSGNLDNWEIYKKWGSPSVTDIFNGSYWGLITSNFLHTEVWHIAFNLYWLFVFGTKIEFESNKLFYGLLILSSALISSLAELSFANATGIGLSGICYSLFGFIFIKSKTSEVYKKYLDKRTIRLFIFWLFLCIFLTQIKAWNVGNAAHISGLLWGMTLAYISKFNNYKQWTIGLLLFSIIASSIFWNPFSISWLSHQAFELHKKQKIDEAINVYKKILNRDKDNEFAKVNLKQLEVYMLQKKAVELHVKQRYNEAKEVYNQILSIDKNNQWAKDNLSILPTK